MPSRRTGTAGSTYICSLSRNNSPPEGDASPQVVQGLSAPDYTLLTGAAVVRGIDEMVPISLLLGSLCLSSKLATPFQHHSIFTPGIAMRSTQQMLLAESGGQDSESSSPLIGAVVQVLLEEVPGLHEHILC